MSRVLVARFVAGVIFQLREPLLQLSPVSFVIEVLSLKSTPSGLLTDSADRRDDSKTEKYELHCLRRTGQEQRKQTRQDQAPAHECQDRAPHARRLPSPALGVNEKALPTCFPSPIESMDLVLQSEFPILQGKLRAFFLRVAEEPFEFPARRAFDSKGGAAIAAFDHGPFIRDVLAAAALRACESDYLHNVSGDSADRVPEDLLHWGRPFVIGRFHRKSSFVRRLVTADSERIRMVELEIGRSHRTSKELTQGTHLNGLSAADAARDAPFDENPEWRNGFELSENKAHSSLGNQSGLLENSPRRQQVPVQNDVLALPLKSDCRAR